MRLLLTHGRSQGGKDPVKLKAEWLEALNRGLQKSGLALPADVEIDFPFYGDRLDDFVRQFELPADPAFVPKGSPVFSEYLAFRSEVASELQAKAGVSDADVKAEMRPLAGQEKGIENWEWAQALIRLLDRRATDVSAGFIETFLRDVFLYVSRPAARDAIDAIVSKELSAETSVVVAHSLGTVVAYNVLRTSPVKPKLFVTLGSPLGIRAIRRKLTPIGNPMPANGWSNAFDPRDVVALYPLDKDNFDVAPEIMNDGDVRNWTDNKHGIQGYLDDGEVAKTICSAL